MTRRRSCSLVEREPVFENFQTHRLEGCDRRLPRNCVAIVDRESVIVSSESYAFQACSIDHSDISPFRINSLRPQVDPDGRDCDKSSNVPRSLTGFPSISLAQVVVVTRLTMSERSRRTGYVPFEDDENVTVARTPARLNDPRRSLTGCGPPGEPPTSTRTRSCPPPSHHR